jgi:HAD superfamily hydrolase (TIGR01509 family)
LRDFRSTTGALLSAVARRGLVVPEEHKRHYVRVVLMRFTGVIFDVGGTLVWLFDNFYETADATTVANTLCAKGLLDISRAAGFAKSLVTWRKTHPKEGDGCRQIHTTRDALAAVMMDYDIDVNEGLLAEGEAAFNRASIAAAVPVSGMTGVIEELAAEVRLAVVSDTRSHGLVDGIVRKLGVRELFDPFITSDAFGWRKPSPRIYQAVVDAWGCPPERVLMVGDSIRKDVRGPQAVGIQAVWLQTTAGDTQDDDAEGVTVIQQPHELLPIALAR